MGKLSSGRVKRTPQTGITSDRYEFLGLSQAEPNLGDPLVGPSSIGANPIPVGSYYQLAAIGEKGRRKILDNSCWNRNNDWYHILFMIMDFFPTMHSVEFTD
jgi:hypothetical protein